VTKEINGDDEDKPEKVYREEAGQLEDYNSQKNHDYVRAGIAYCLVALEIVVVGFVLFKADGEHFDRYKDILTLLSPAIFGFIGYYASQKSNNNN
jgi:hypothetical protein